MLISDVDNDGESNADASSGVSTGSRNRPISTVGGNAGGTRGAIFPIDATGMARPCSVGIGIAKNS